MLGEESLKVRDIPDLTRFVTEPSGKVHLAMLSTRPGVLVLSAAIEWTWFPPTETRGALFSLCGVHWEELLWFVASLPMAKFNDVKRMARQLGMRIADGVPTILTPAAPGDRIHPQFPGFAPKFFPGAMLPNGKNNTSMFSVENDKDSPVYQNKRRVDEDIRACELEIVDVLGQGRRLTTSQIADYIYGSGPFPHEQPI